jgi:hypothetical protein
MYDLILSVEQTPHGVRVNGPDRDRTVYLPTLNRLPRLARVHSDVEPVWSSAELDVYVSPLPSGAEVKIKVHASQKPCIPATIAKAA